jgi:serine/threonine protein phosphatase 1
MRTLAIGDVHGCSAALDHLLKLVRPGPDDRLVFLGDYVDRGPDSRGVLDRLIRLHATGRVVALRGNHEVMMLAAREDYQSWEGWLRVGGQQALDSYGRGASLDDVPAAHWRFMELLCVDWYETARHIFVHACVDPALAMADQHPDILHWRPVSRSTPPHHSGKRVVCGHTAQKSGEPLHLGHLVCIDTHAHGGGWLTCLHAETGRIWQADQRGRTRTAYLDEPGD